MIFPSNNNPPQSATKFTSYSTKIASYHIVLVRSPTNILQSMFSSSNDVLYICNLPISPGLIKGSQYFAHTVKKALIISWSFTISRTIRSNLSCCCSEGDFAINFNAS